VSQTTNRIEEISVEEAAALLHASPRTVINYLRLRLLRGTKVSKRWFVELSSVHELQGKGVIKTDRVQPAGDKIKLAALGRIKDAYSECRIRQGVGEEKWVQEVEGNLLRATEHLYCGYHSGQSEKLTCYRQARDVLAKNSAMTFLHSTEGQMHTLCEEALDAVCALYGKMRSRTHEGT